jgi:LCP family protein required for cell wall assembly
MTQKKFDFARNLRAFNRPTTRQFIMTGVGLVLAIALFVFLRGFVSCWRLTSLPGMPVPSCPGQNSAPATNPQGTPVAVGTPTATATVSAPQAELPLPWDGASRVNILVMGYDYGDWAADRSCPCRSDSMIVLTIDPLSKTAGMLSIPRDMWTNIPGFGYFKINTANYLGDLYKLPGGGPELARKTVENFLGIPIQYYVMIDFTSFVTIMDDIAGRGGICLVIPEDIVIDPLGPDNTEYLKAGPDCFNGAEVLAYARMRHTANDDIDRSARQQQLIMSIRDKLLQPGNLVNLLGKAPAIYNEVSAGIKTNLPSIDDARRLAVLAMQIPLDQIQKHVIDYTMSAPGQVTVDGAIQDIIKPYPDKIRELVDQVFGVGSLKPMASGDPTQLMQQEAASVIVVNASGVDGIASRTSDYLKAQGMNVTKFGNTSDYPDKYIYPPLPGRTMLILHAGKPYATQYLMALMKFTAQSQFIVDFDPNAPADIVLAVGADWANNSPMP